MKLKTLLTIMICFILLISLASCGGSEDGDADGTEDINDTEEVVYPFVGVELTEREKELAEKITGKKFSEITQKDVDGVTKVTVIGENVSEYNYIIECSKEGYYYGEELYSYGKDYSDALSVLKYFKNIRSLGIYYCPELTDASFIKEFVKLKKLELVMTGVTDLTMLKDQDALENIRVEMTPLKTLALSEKASLLSANFSGCELSDMIAFRNTQIIMLYINNRVPIENSDALADISGMAALELIAPEFDTSFLGKMKSKLSTLRIGGYDEMDLSGIEDHLESLGHIGIYNSSNTDLTPLDELSDECTIKTIASPTDKRGKRTEIGAENYTDEEIYEYKYGWYYE